MKKTILWIFLGLLFPIANAVQAVERLPREVVINSVEFVHVPQGWFWYAVSAGSPDHDNQMHKGYRDVKIWLDGFYIAKYEARARDFTRFMSASTHSPTLHKLYDEGATAGCSVRRNDEGSYFLIQPDRDLPVTHLSWQLADEMARWLGFRLPTEAEWAKAARGTDRRIWPWGDEYPDDTFAAYEGGTECRPVPVDAFPNGRSPYGAYGMAGGVYEYVDDWYNTRFYAALKDGDRNPRPETALPARSETSAQVAPLKVLKGGRWASQARGIAVHGRTTAEIDYAFRCYGTRFAIDEAEVEKQIANGGAMVTAQ